MVELVGTKATGVVTNVPGPHETRYLTGKPVRQLLFWVPQAGQLGLGVSICSYTGAVGVGVTTDAGLVSDPEAIVAGFQAELDELLDLVRLVEVDKVAEGQKAESSPVSARSGDLAQPDRAAIKLREAVYETIR